jgi:hypothetical protein
MKMAVFWDVASCSLVEVYRRFIALMMEAASTAETSVNFYQNTRRNIPDDSHLVSDAITANVYLLGNHRLFLRVTQIKNRGYINPYIAFGERLLYLDPDWFAAGCDRTHATL